MPQRNCIDPTDFLLEAVRHAVIRDTDINLAEVSRRFLVKLTPFLSEVSSLCSVLLADPRYVDHAEDIRRVAKFVQDFQKSPLRVENGEVLFDAYDARAVTILDAGNVWCPVTKFRSRVDAAVKDAVMESIHDPTMR